MVSVSLPFHESSTGKKTIKPGAPPHISSIRKPIVFYLPFNLRNYLAFSSSNFYHAAFALYTNSLTALIILCVICHLSVVQCLIFLSSQRIMSAPGHWLPRRRMVLLSRSLYTVRRVRGVKALSRPTFESKSILLTSKMVGSIGVWLPPPF